MADLAPVLNKNEAWWPVTATNTHGYLNAKRSLTSLTREFSSDRLRNSEKTYTATDARVVIFKIASGQGGNQPLSL